MTKERAIAEAVRARQYLPYRIHGIYFDGIAWGSFNATSKRRQNDLLRKGFEVYLIG